MGYAAAVLCFILSGGLQRREDKQEVEQGQNKQQNATKTKRNYKSWILKPQKSRDWRILTCQSTSSAKALQCRYVIHMNFDISEIKTFSAFFFFVDKALAALSQHSSAGF